MFSTDNIRELSTRQAVLDFQDLKNNRHKDGFQHFIPDLAKEADAAGNGWRFKKGLLTVKDPHDSNEIMNFLESKLRHHAWFQTRAQKTEMLRQGKIIESPQLPVGYDQYTQVFKSLGYWGKNPAMDVGTFILNEDDSLSMQVIIRQHDKKHAFVGGMIDKDVAQQKAVVIKKCQQEFIEEFYSNDLFAKNSATLRQASNFDQQFLMLAIEQVLNDAEFAKLENLKEQLHNIFQQPNLNFYVRINELEKQLYALGLQSSIRKEDLDVFWVRIKCKLYQALFPQQYNALCQFLEDRLVAMPETTNESDPRNTQEAFMTTTPHYFFIDKQALTLMQKSWFVEAKGGDDAESAKIVRLETLFDKPMFSAHGRILLDMLADKSENDVNFLNNPVIQAQIEAIEKKIKQREERELNFLPTANRAALQTVANKPQFVITSGQANLDQLNSVLGLTSDSTMTLASTAQDASQTLIDYIGPQRYARMEDILEKSGLPASSRVVLATLCNYARINILLDNSGSMTTGYSSTASRWDEAYERLKKILPLLALAGAKVELRLLNGDGMPTEFDFSKKSIGDSVTVMEGKLSTALNSLGNIFRSGPNGGTLVNSHFEAMFQKARNNDKHLSLFITDGDATDKDVAIRTLNNRNKAQYPITVVACTKESNEISWVKELARNAISGVCMLNDFNDEKSRLHGRHGPLIPYSRSIWLLLHITAPGFGHEVAEGLAVYHQADQVDSFSIQQLTQLLGYTVRNVDYREYLSSQNNADLPMAEAVELNAQQAQQAAPMVYGFNAQQQQARVVPNQSQSASATNSNPLFRFFG